MNGRPVWKNGLSNGQSHRAPPRASTVSLLKRVARKTKGTKRTACQPGSIRNRRSDLCTRRTDKGPIGFQTMCRHPFGPKSQPGTRYAGLGW